MIQAINLPALRWAYEQEGLSVTAKAVLVTFALHANDRGYSWPSVERIASTWRMDRETVRRQIEALLVRRMICPTKKRCGVTGQVKVYRLPKITYESGGKCRSFGNHGSGGQARDKRGISGGKSAPNNDNNRTTNKYHDAIKALGNSTSFASVNGSPKSVSSFFEDHQNQNQPVHNHVKWPEFAAWCGSKGGTPTETGFRKWLNGQKLQWRSKVRQEGSGYVLDGKFYSADEANRMGRENPGLITKFRKAIMRDGKIQIIERP